MTADLRKNIMKCCNSRNANNIENQEIKYAIHKDSN